MAEQLGMRVLVAEHSSLRVRNRTLECTNQTGRAMQLDCLDRIWLVGLGERQTFLDRMQLLHGIDCGQFVNSVSSFMHLHSKAAFLLEEVGAYFPETIVSNNLEELLQTIRQGGSWVLKPTAQSYGRGVKKIDSQTEDLNRIVSQALEEGYALLQKFVGSERELRWLVVNGNVLSAYHKYHPYDFRGNLATGARPTSANPDKSETALAEDIARHLKQAGIRFATLDCVGNFLLDVNFVNPGWLQTFKQVAGQDFTEKAVSCALIPPPLVRARVD